MVDDKPRTRVRLLLPADERVGYGRPPRAHQFKPGQSGNPKGRQKGRKNEATILNELLYRKIQIREGARTRTVIFLEALLLRYFESALKGDTKSAAFILNRLRDAVDPAAPGQSMNEDDRQVLESYRQRLLTQARKGQS
jgi:hypothetical protein